MIQYTSHIIRCIVDYYYISMYYILLVFSIVSYIIIVLPVWLSLLLLLFWLLFWFVDFLVWFGVGQGLFQYNEIPPKELWKQFFVSFLFFLVPGRVTNKQKQRKNKTKKFHKFFVKRASFIWHFSQRYMVYYHHLHRLILFFP